MNLLLRYYVDKNTIEDWKIKYSSAAQEVIMYKFKGTNGRYLTSYDSKFEGLKEVEGMPRSEWSRYENGQDNHKQYTVPMIETKLFYKENDKYYRTAKGIVYEKYLDAKFNLDEKWLINYLLLMDSTINNRENYLINRSIDINNILIKNTSESFVIKACEDLFCDRNSFTASKELAKYDYLYLNSFYLEPEFLKLFFESSEKDREELKEYVYNNWQKRNYACCISQKFVGTNYSKPELIDDLKIFMFSLEMSKIKYTEFEDTIRNIIHIYSSEYDINEDAVVDFVMENKNIFEPILINVFKVEEAEDSENEEEDLIYEPTTINIDLTKTGDKPETRIDDTTIEGKRKLKSIFAMRKRIAREKSHYTCELEGYKGCRYFTSKTTNHNYVEVHHFVPREFRNNFENSVDVLANYITLCPHCHRLIHLATDRERIDVIRYIYNQRIDRLKKCGIEVEFKDLLCFYNVETES